MPVHDWSKVDANIFHDFHQAWSISIRNALNSGLLPPGFSALVEQHAKGLIPDVLALQRRSTKGPSNRKGGVLVATPPRTQMTFQSKEQKLLNRANRIAIRHRLGEVVCIIEIISPGNKSSRSAINSFVEKTREFLEAGVNVLVIDLLPPTPRDPAGIHKAIWDELEGDVPFDLPVDQPLVMAAYVAGDISVGRSIRAYVEPFGVGNALIDMPAYLDADCYVPVPLESTYLTTWNACPADMRFLVEQGRLPDEPA